MYCMTVTQHDDNTKKRSVGWFKDHTMLLLQFEPPADDLL